MSAEGVAKALSKPLIKLLDVCQKGVGKLYEPTNIRRISKAIRENNDLPISYSDGHITIDGTSSDELTKRMQKRLCYQEMKKQSNIDNIISDAYSQLEAETEVSKEALDEDWITRFFNTAGEISNEQMQIIWGAVLAGELKKPGTYSLRTLEVLRNISEEEARIFKKLSSFVFSTTKDCFIFRDNIVLEKLEIGFDDIIKLIDIGIINPIDTLHYEFENDIMGFIYCGKALLFNLNDKSEKKSTFPIYKLTNVGNELLSLNNITFNIKHISLISNELIKKHHISLSYANLISSDDNGFEYDKDTVTPV